MRVVLYSILCDGVVEYFSMYGLIMVGAYLSKKLFMTKPGRQRAFCIVFVLKLLTIALAV